jgi:hypothetical protein
VTEFAKGQQSMKVVFTLCSNNYLAQAKTLGDSVIEHNPDYQFVIGLVDRNRADVDYDFFRPHRIIEVGEVGIPNFSELYQRYGIIELNTAVKPFVFQYLFESFDNLQGAIYLDPDIMVFNSLDSIYEELDRHSMVLTPHALSPVPFDDHRPQENVFLAYGIYNLGFIAVANVPEGRKFLEWWSERTFHLGDISAERGLFVDQLWLNLATVFFENVKVSYHPGRNVAYWNLHERNISRENGILAVNEEFPLVFYHFSSYNFADASSMSRHQDRFSFESRPDVAELFETYRKNVAANKHEYFSGIECHYVIERKQYLETAQRNREAAKKRSVLQQMKQLTPNFIKSLSVSLIRKVDSLRTQ